MSADAHFSSSYAEARGKFLQATAAAGLTVQSHAHPLAGREGETLAMDVARLGSADAAAVLVLSSACHGVEGYCGSGVQHALLSDAGFLATARASGVAMLWIHALNPHGFSWWRRTTHENVDLNRNFHPYDGRPLPVNAGYAELADALLPATWPPTPENEAVLAAYAERHGAFGLQAAISGGQYSHPDGLFFGGLGPTWSHLVLRQVLREHAGGCRRLGWVDVHTGLGPSGHGEKIFAGPNDAAAIARAKAWWGNEVTSTYDGSSTSAPLEGLMWNVVKTVNPQAEYTGIALEYGTVPVPEVMTALRGDHWLRLHPETGAAQRGAIQRQMLQAFYTDTPAWKAAIVEQGHAAVRQALKGLAGG